MLAIIGWIGSYFPSSFLFLFLFLFFNFRVALFRSALFHMNVENHSTPQYWSSQRWFIKKFESRNFSTRFILAKIFMQLCDIQVLFSAAIAAVLIYRESGVLVYLPVQSCSHSNAQKSAEVESRWITLLALVTSLRRHAGFRSSSRSLTARWTLLVIAAAAFNSRTTDRRVFLEKCELHLRIFQTHFARLHPLDTVLRQILKHKHTFHLTESLNFQANGSSPRRNWFVSNQLCTYLDSLKLVLRGQPFVTASDGDLEGGARLFEWLAGDVRGKLAHLSCQIGQWRTFAPKFVDRSTDKQADSRVSSVSRLRGSEWSLTSPIRCEKRLHRTVRPRRFQTTQMHSVGHNSKEISYKWFRRHLLCRRKLTVSGLLSHRRLCTPQRSKRACNSYTHTETQEWPFRPTLIRW